MELPLINTQVQEQYITEKDADPDILDVQDVWDTIQGEMPFSGSPAVFVRLAGCNLQCPHCDTDYTSNRRKMFFKEVLEEMFILQMRNKLAVITGGEPFRQNITKLVGGLLDKGWRVQIETNGVFHRPDFPYYTHREVFVVVSPKTPKIHPAYVSMWTTNPARFALRYVVSAKSLCPNGLPEYVLGATSFKEHVWHPHIDGIPIFISPEDVNDPIQNKMNLEACVNSAMKHGYMISLQTHKILGVR